MVTTRLFHHVLIKVNDLEKARNFYGRVLGLQEIQRGNMNAPALWYGIGDNELHIAVTKEPALPPKPLGNNPPVQWGRQGVHIAFTMDASLQEISKYLQSQGIQCVIEDSILPQVFCEDGNGNLVELNTGWEQAPVG